MIAAYAWHEPDKLDTVLPRPRPPASVVIRDGRVISGNAGAFVRARQEATARA